MKKPKEDKWNAVKTRTLISKLLKKETPRRKLSAYLGFNSKVVQYIIDRWGLDEGLVKPVLTGVR